MNLIEWLIVLAIAGILVAVGYSAYDDVTAAKFELRKDQWECAEYRDTTTFIYTGKVVVPIVNHECQEWRRVR